MSKSATFGVIIGNRGFFPDILARDGREEILRVLEKDGYGSVCLTPQDTKFGSVETLQDANKCADLFRQHRDEIDGVLCAEFQRLQRDDIGRIQSCIAWIHISRISRQLDRNR